MERGRNMIRVPKELQLYIEIIDGKVEEIAPIPARLKDKCEAFKREYKELQENNPLTDF